MFVYFRFEFPKSHVTLGSVQYGHSVQYARGLLHAPLEYGLPIALALIDSIDHEINIDIILNLSFDYKYVLH